MSKRHAWAPLLDTSRWRILERCTKCGLRRWLIEFKSKRGAATSMHLHSRDYDGWSTYRPACTEDDR